MTNKNDFSGRAITDPSGKTIGTTNGIATEDQLGGSGSDTPTERALAGYVAWREPGGSTQTRDPTNFGNLGAAVQDAIDAAEASTSTAVPIHVPHYNKNGTETTISQTATFTTTYPQFVGGGGRGGPFINVTITDGSPAFEVGNMNLAGVTIQGANADADGNDAEFIRFSDTTAPVYQGGNLVAFGGAAPANSKGAIVINNRSWNGVIREVNFSGFPRSGKKTMDGMVAIGADNDTGNPDDIGEWGITGISSYSDPDNPINAVVSDNGINWRNVRIINNRMEGAGGNGMIDFTSGYPLIMGNQMARTENTADRIHTTGFYAWIGPNIHSSSCGGSAVYTRSPGVVNNSVRYSGVGAHAIDANFNPGGTPADKLQLPNPNAIAGGHTVNYQSGASNVHVVQTSNPT